jgi:hypothetical protein
MDHDELMTRLRELVREAIGMRYQGGLHAKKVEAQAYADGYMRALTDSQQIDTAELLRVVGEERSRMLDRPSS